MRLGKDTDSKRERKESQKKSRRIVSFDRLKCGRETQRTKPEERFGVVERSPRNITPMGITHGSIIHFGSSQEVEAGLLGIKR